MADASIEELFPPDDVVARFVVSMAMAKNDLELGLRDTVVAGEVDGHDFNYRLRLTTSHLVEAILAFNFYSSQEQGVRDLLEKVPSDGQEQLKNARTTLQKAGSAALFNLRNNTFHYPRPDAKYNPTSDEQLRDVLVKHGSNRGTIAYKSETDEIFLTFADELATALALEEHSADPKELLGQLEIVRDGAIAFVNWGNALVIAYFESTGVQFGNPEPIA